MGPRQEPPVTLDRVALHQGGVVTSRQLQLAGLSRHAATRLVRDGRWASLGFGLYATSAAVSWETWAWAGHLVGGERSRLAAQASGHLLGLVPTAPEPVDLLVPWDSMVRSRGPWTFRRERPGARSPRTAGSPPRLTVEDTVLDLCEQGPPAEAVTWVTRAVQKKLTTTRRLSGALDDRARHRLRSVLVDLLADVDLGVESPLELRYLRDVERAHKLPPGKRQRSRTGLPYRTDIVYLPCPLVVELDGRQGHEADGAFRDSERDDLFLLDGCPTLRFGHFAVLDHPCVVAARVARGLQQCGWPGLPTRCRHCLRVPEGSWHEMS